MKNVINYYYGLSFKDIHQTDDYYKFVVGNDLYYFMHYQRNIEELSEIYEISNELLKRQIYCHQIILNNTQQLLTYVNGEPYLLMKIWVKENRPLTINDIMAFSYQTMGIIGKDLLRRNKWSDLWASKIDFMEYQVNQLGKKFPLIRESFSYFVGLGENAITFIQTIPNEKQMLGVSHRRLKKGDTLFDLYHPLNFVIDDRIRDACEYFKTHFLEEDDTFEQIKLYVSYNQLTVDECKRFFARLLFPTFYFDLYEDIMLEKKEEKELVPILLKINVYEHLLQSVYFYFKSMFPMPDIEWLMKNVK